MLEYLRITGLQQWLLLRPGSSTAVKYALCTWVSVKLFVWWSGSKDEDAAASSAAGIDSLFSPTLARVSLELSPLLLISLVHRTLTFSPFFLQCPACFFIARIVKVKHLKMLYSELSNFEAIDPGSMFLWLNLGTLPLSVQEWQYWGSSLLYVQGRVQESWVLFMSPRNLQLGGLMEHKEIVYLVAFHRFLFHVFPWIPLKSVQTFTTQNILHQGIPQLD